MTGKPDFNRAAFNRAQALLESDKLFAATIRPFVTRSHAGDLVVVTPVSEDIRVYGSWEEAIGHPWKEHLARDVATVPTCDAVVLIDGWENSRGANLEARVAFALEIPVFVLLESSSTFAPRIKKLKPDDFFGARRLGDVASPPPTEATELSRSATMIKAPLPNGVADTPEARARLAALASLYSEEDGGRFVPFSEDPRRHLYETGGVKDNRGKAPINLLPSESIVAIADVLAFGAKKYKPHNWMLGLPLPDTFDSLMRHLLAWNAGEDLDPETGKSHLAHAGCQLMFLLWYVLTGTGAETDNRFRRPEGHEQPPVEEGVAK